MKILSALTEDGSRRWLSKKDLVCLTGVTTSDFPYDQFLQDLYDLRIIERREATVEEYMLNLDTALGRELYFLNATVVAKYWGSKYDRAIRELGTPALTLEQFFSIMPERD